MQFFMIETNHLLVLTTCPDQRCAESIATALVSSNLAACVNIQPGLRSVYRWQGAIESSEEVLLIIKSIAERYQEVETAIRDLHPYELPEVIAVPIVAGSKSYLRWLEAGVQRSQ